MKAIILAAGIGSRLRPITNDKPKTLTKVNGRPMIDFLISALCENKIKDIVVCTGFKSDMLVNFCKNNYPEINFTFVENSDYDITNNMYSLYLASKYLDEDVILMNADLVFYPEVIRKLLKMNSSAVAVDKGNYLEESMKLVVDNDLIKRISKKIDKNNSYGSSIDVYKINSKDCPIIKKEMEKIIEENNDKNQWTEVMLDNLFQNDKLKAKPCSIDGEKWFEIDNYEDLAKAEIIFNDKLKQLKSKKVFFIDRDGTLTLGKGLIKNSSLFLDKLKEKNKNFFILTNNSSKTPNEHFENFEKLGLKIEKENVLVSIDASISFFKEKKVKKIYWVANKKVDTYIKECGFLFDDKNPQAALLTFDNEINYAKLVKFTQFIRKGVPYYATHSDLVCPTENGDVPDIGSFIKLIEITTKKIPNKVFGKPNIEFIEHVLKKYQLKFSDAVVIGDRLYTDIKLAENTDITSILVLSGETKREDYEKSKISADIVVSDVSKLINFV